MRRQVAKAVGQAFACAFWPARVMHLPTPGQRVFAWAFLCLLVPYAAAGLGLHLWALVDQSTVETLRLQILLLLLAGLLAKRLAMAWMTISSVSNLAQIVTVLTASTLGAAPAHPLPFLIYEGALVCLVLVFLIRRQWTGLWLLSSRVARGGRSK